MAKIQRLLSGKDGLNRGAVLKVANKSGRLTTLQRPLQLLYPLGVTQSMAENESDPDHGNISEPEKETSNLPPRPKRDSALRARDQVCAWTSELLEEENLVDHFLVSVVNPGECVEL